MNERAVPILPSRDLRESLGFYEKLGFENRGAPPEEWNYMILGRGSIELHFIGQTTSFAEWTAPASCHLAVADADALHAGVGSGRRHRRSSFDHRLWDA